MSPDPDLDALADRAVDLVSRLDLRLAIAESLTGGLVAASVTVVPGASRAFRGAVVAYCDPAKSALLAVPRSLLARYSAVSAPVALAMAQGVKDVFDCGVGLATTGEAGPTSGSGRPVGSVYVALCAGSASVVRALSLSGDREQVRRAAAVAALGLLLHTLGNPRAAQPSGAGTEGR